MGRASERQVRWTRSLRPFLQESLHTDARRPHPRCVKGAASGCQVHQQLQPDSSRLADGALDEELAQRLGRRRAALPPDAEDALCRGLVDALINMRAAIFTNGATHNLSAKGCIQDRMPAAAGPTHHLFQARFQLPGALPLPFRCERGRLILLLPAGRHPKPGKAGAASGKACLERQRLQAQLMQSDGLHDRDIAARQGGYA